MAVVVMGVSGCGKSTIGALIANDLSATFIDGDDLHPDANRQKMSSGIPLTDEDRMPWLTVIGQELSGPTSKVIAASALKRKYRDAIRAIAPNTLFVHLALSKAVATKRVSDRADHFMPASLIDSQFEALEPLQADEAGITIDATLRPDEILAAVTTYLK